MSRLIALRFFVGVGLLGGLPHRSFAESATIAPDILASGLHHQADRDYPGAILEYDRVLSEGFAPDLTMQLMIQSYDNLIQDELAAALVPKYTVAQQTLPDLCFDECPIYDINWHQTNPRG